MAEVPAAPAAATITAASRLSATERGADGSATAPQWLRQAEVSAQDCLSQAERDEAQSLRHPAACARNPPTQTTPISPAQLTVTALKCQENPAPNSWDGARYR